MADTFSPVQMRRLINGKRLLLMGDSNTRSLYKDLIWLYHYNLITPQEIFRKKLEASYMGDSLVNKSVLSRGRDFIEHRLFERSGTAIEYIFITKCYNSLISQIFRSIKEGSHPLPDVVLLSSCLWDVCRWGPDGVDEYKKNLVLLMKLLDESLPKSTLVIWGTALPPGPTIKGGLVIKQIEFMQSTMRVEIMEANRYAADVVSSVGFDVLDFHYYLHMQVFRRCNDGVHYGPVVTRFMSNLLLTHISVTWDIQIPVNTVSALLKEVCDNIKSGSRPPASAIVSLDNVASQLQNPPRETMAPPTKIRHNRKWQTRAQKRLNAQYMNIPVRRNMFFHPYKR